MRQQVVQLEGNPDRGKKGKRAIKWQQQSNKAEYQDFWTLKT